MSIPVLSITPPEPIAIPRRDVLRYMRCREGDAPMEALANEAIAAVEPLLRVHACFAVYPLTTDGDTLHLGFANVESRSLRRHLDGCSEVLAFAATVGSEVDRLLLRLSATSPARAVVADAAATAAIEVVCDRLCTQWEAAYAHEGRALRPRFSAGYGDCPLSLQIPLIRALDTPRRIGVSLTDSLLMTPTKSVTALVGITPPTEGQAK